MVLPPEALVGLPVHPLRLLWERLRYVRTPTEHLPDGLRLVKSPVHSVLPLALVDQIVAMTAQEILPRSVQDRHPPATYSSGTDEPRPLSSEVAICPV